MPGALPRLLAAFAALLLAGCSAGRNGPSPIRLPGPLYTLPVQERTVPAGQVISLRTLEGIAAEQAMPDRSFSALIVRDVLDANGKVLIPTGSQARLIVIAAPDGRLSLGLHSARVFGNTYTLVPADAPLSANTASRTAPGAGELDLGMPLGVLVDGKVGHGTEPLERGRLVVEGAAVQVPDNTLLLYRLLRPAVIH